MKRITFLLVVLFLYATNAISQNMTIYEEGKRWVVDLTKWGQEVLGTSTLVVRGDSVVDGKSYKKVYVAQKENLEDLGFYYLGRDEGGVAYILDDGVEYCFFDFNLKVGDEFVSELGKLASVADDCKFIVKEVSMMETPDGVLRKCFVVEVCEYWSNEFESGWYNVCSFTFIEGIGEVGYGLFFNYCIGCTGGGVYKLRNVYNAAGLCIFGANAAGVDDIKDANVKNAVLYDLSGRKFNENNNNGIYIQNGKKYLNVK